MLPGGGGGGVGGASMPNSRDSAGVGGSGVAGTSAGGGGGSGGGARDNASGGADDDGARAPRGGMASRAPAVVDNQSAIDKEVAILSTTTVERSWTVAVEPTEILTLGLIEGTELEAVAREDVATCLALSGRWLSFAGFFFIRSSSGCFRCRLILFFSLPKGFNATNANI